MTKDILHRKMVQLFTAASMTVCVLAAVTASGVENITPFEPIVVDYQSQTIKHIRIEPIALPVDFEKGFNTRQYYLLIQSWLDRKYPSAFNEKAWATIYFFRALAEYVYSTNGRLDPDFFNAVAQSREVFFKIDYHIQNIKVNDDVKYALTKLYAFASIYKRIVDPENEISKKLSMIPKDSVLFLIPEMDQPLYTAEFPQVNVGELPKKDKSESTTVLGTYAITDFGVNLYYICADHYPGFKDLPPQTQLKIINYIYMFNPTLTEAPDIRLNYYWITYLYRKILAYFFPDVNPPLLKYALKGEINWLILPKDLNEFKNK